MVVGVLALVVKSVEVTLHKLGLWLRTLLHGKIATKHGQADFVLNQVWASWNFKQLGIDVLFTELSFKPLLNRILLLNLGLSNIWLDMLRSLSLDILFDICFHMVGFLFLRWVVLLLYWNSCKSLHGLNTLLQFVNWFRGNLHLYDILLHASQVSVHVLLHKLRWQINPDVQNTVFIFFLESFLEIPFDLSYNCVSSLKVWFIPFSISLNLPLFTFCSVR